MDNSVVVRCPGGKVSFTIYQTPLVEDHQDPGLQREYTPAVPEDDVTVLPASVALRPRNAAEATKWKPVTENDLGTDYLVAVKNGHGIAIRAHDATDGYQFRVKIKAAGVNVASPPPFISSLCWSVYPNYFIMPDQQWVFGARVGRSSVRQFRVVKSGTRRFSLKSLYKREEEESIEIQVTGFRRPRNVGSASSHSIQSTGGKTITYGETELSLTIAGTATGFTIFIKAMNGKTITLERLAESDTVEDLKTKIQFKEGIPIDQQRIIIWGTEMEDAWTLSECNIKNEDTAYLLLGSGIRSALYDLPGSENAETSFKPEQLGLGGLMHQNFTIDPEPEGWERHGTLAMRFYFFDTGHFKRKTGLELDAADNVERQCQVDGFVEDRFPSFRGRPAMVLMPSIAQLYKQFKGERRKDAGNQDCAQNGQDPGQQGDMNEEVNHGERSIVLTQKQSPGKKFLSTLMCGREW